MATTSQPPPGNDPALLVPRERCLRCRRPQSVCYCAHLASLPTETRVLVLQHPKEQHMAIGTARMAHLALPNSSLRVGLDFSKDAEVVTAIAPPQRAYVVFPSEHAVDARTLAGGEPITLVVIDGTWWQAQKLLKLNPALRALPHIAFVPERPSQYRIRRQPASHCVSTVEALAQVLTALEPDAGPFTRLLDPFLAMVDRQAAFATEVKSSRHSALAAARKKKGPPPTLADRLAVPWEQIVCVHGEANAWPIRHPDHAPAETVMWTAHRPSTGETFECVIRPRRQLAPSTANHLDVTREELMAGVDVAQWQSRWRAFVREDDVFVQWGTFTGKLALGCELPRPARLIELRSEALQQLRAKVGTVEECLAMIGGEAVPVGVRGRAGRRLAAQVAVLRALWRMPRRGLSRR